MALRLTMLLAVIFFSIPLAHAGKYYKWVDKNGGVSYHDQPPSESGYRVEEKDLDVRHEPAQRVPQSVVDKFPVVLYSTTNCGPCDSARNYLKNRGVPFKEKNVQGNAKLQQELMTKSGGISVPTIMVGTKVMRGYIETLLQGELDDAGYPKTASKSKEAQPGSEEEEKPAS